MTIYSELDWFVITEATYGAVAGGSNSQASAIQAAITAATNNGGGVVVFPGAPDTYYNIGSQLTITSSNITLWAPGGARLRILSAATVALAVGNIETGLDPLNQSNTLASNVAAGALSIALSTGKGANFSAGDLVVIRSDAVLPDHDPAVTSKRAEFVRVRSVSTDTLNIDRPLRFGYNTADSAKVCKITWIENFAIDGLAFDGNNQTDCAIAVQLSWCYKPQIRRLAAKNLQQRLLRLQGCYQTLVDDLSQENGLSHGFLGDSNHFAYMLAEGALNEGLIASNLRADRVRHGYTNGGGWTTNAAVTSSMSIGAPMNFNVGPGVHTNARGAGWDTHEVGLDGVLHDLQTLGSLGVGLQNRCVRTRIYNFFARDCIGAAIQIGSDAQDTTIESWDFHNCNLGTDEASSTDWTKQSPIQDNSPRSYLSRPAPNEVDNGDFDLWERGTSFTSTGGTANRWKLTEGSGAAVTVSREAHIVGSGGPLVGRYYLRFQRSTTGSGASTLSQCLGNDSVRHLAGQRIVVSFRARSDVNGMDLRVYLRQYFGSGGSPSAPLDTTVHTRELDVNFRRYSAVIEMPSITGKTIGTNEDSYSILIFELPTSEGTCFFDIDAVKLEVGRVPTTYVPESLAVTKERCARWFEKSYTDDQNPGSGSQGGNATICGSTANANVYRRNVHFTTRKGRLPTVTLYASSSGAINKVRNVTQSLDRNADVALIGLQSFRGGIQGSGDVTALDVVQFSWVAAVADFE